MAPKKAAKKAAKKGRKDGGTKDLRRAYEHLHRVGLMHDWIPAEARRQIETLSRSAIVAFTSQEFESAADLLRAAEHLCFGSMASESREQKLSDEVVSTARDEYQHLTDRASRHWGRHDESAEPDLAEIYNAALQAAQDALVAGALYRALEYARAADALAELEPRKQKRLKESAPGKHLGASATA